MSEILVVFLLVNIPSWQNMLRNGKEQHTGFSHAVKSEFASADLFFSHRHANGRADHLLEHPFAYQTAAIKKGHWDNTELTYNEHLTSQAMYNNHARFAP